MLERDWAALPLGDHVLAESPRWDEKRQRLSWVDIVVGTVSCSMWGESGWGPVSRHRVGRVPTAAEPLDAQDGWAVAVDGGIRILKGDGSVGPPVAVSPEFPKVRTNDMTTAPGGRLLIGLFTEDGTSPRGGVVALDLVKGVTSVVVEGFVTANGLAVTLDGSSLYAVDTGRGTISRHDIHADHALGAAGGVVVVRHTGPGKLDGIVLGPDGDLWAAVWGAGEVRRYASDGTLRSAYRAPVVRPSALEVVAVGGQSWLVLTTARSDLSGPQPVGPAPEGRIYWTPLPD